VYVLPEPVGSVFNLLMNSNGEVTHKELTKKKVGVIDVGFRTMDSTILDHMKYVDRGSCTIETGISTSFDEIANHLWEMTGIAIELYRLYKAIEAGAITIRGQKFNISSLTSEIRLTPLWLGKLPKLSINCGLTIGISRRLS
jgi:plasmid segregation protein ParM